MKIISKAYDYYDTVAYTDSPVFVRHEKDYANYSPPKEIEDIFEKAPFEYPHSVESQTVLIGFCGRIYPLIILSHSQYEHHYGPTVIHTVFCYSQSDILKFFSLTKLKPQNEIYIKKRKTISHVSFSKRNMDILFGFHGKKISDDIFFELNSPVFIITRKRHSKEYQLTVNSSLKERGFQKIFNPFQAYQEIEMYLGGVLGQTEINTVGISDEDLKHQKGFDKWSFKKMPTKRGRK